MPSDPNADELEALKKNLAGLNRKKRVLLVDDEEMARVAIVMLLERLGCEVQEAGSAEKAMELFKASEFDFVMLDLKMPGISGVEVYKEIKQINPKIPVVIITGMELEGGLAKDARQAGAKLFLQKPASVDDLKEIIEFATI